MEEIVNRPAFPRAQHSSGFVQDSFMIRLLR